MVLDRAAPRELHQAVGRELEHVGHDAEVHAELLQGVVRLRAPQRGELEDLHATLLRRGPSASTRAPGFSGAQNTPATSSLRVTNASSTALPKSC